MRGPRQVAMEAAFGVDLVQKRDEVGWSSGIAVEKDQRSDGVARRRPIDVLNRHLRRSPSGGQTHPASLSRAAPAPYTLVLPSRSQLLACERPRWQQRRGEGYPAELVADTRAR